jgi:tetratricopeptide repeat protein 30
MQIRDGLATKTIYEFIHDQKYDEAIKYLNQGLQQFPTSSAAVSLLGYCYYHKQDFTQAGATYSQLVQHCPEVDAYKLYHAQSLIKAGMLEEAADICTTVEDPNLAHRVLTLQAWIKYDQDELQVVKAMLDRFEPEDPDKIIMDGCILWKEKNIETARQHFTDAMNVLGYMPALAYNIALCYYSMKQYGQALRHIAEIIERGVRNHPELGVGTNSEELDVRSVGNTSILRDTALVEAFNLKAAIEYQSKQLEEAKMALSDMPPRSETEYDPVTLHNQALMHMDSNATEGFRKLNYLLQHPPFPPETLVNLLLLYCKYNYYDLAADILAENAELTYKYLEQDDYEFLDALILAQASPEEAYKRFDELSVKHIDKLRKVTKAIQDARRNRDNGSVKNELGKFDAALAKYIPVLMGQAKIYWDMENYAQVEKIFRQSAEFCSEDESWKLNVAHIFFMQEKYKECVRYYEPFVRAHSSNMLQVQAIVLANLCVAYVMTSANEDAEELMRQVEKEEEKLEDGTMPTYHLCIINLVIGTLYCAKGNFEFGISRIIKSMEPYERKLGMDTWYYAKRCLVALLEALVKNMMMIKDETFHEILQFLDQVAHHGKNIKAQINPVDANAPTQMVGKEARMLKKAFLQINS